MRWKKVREEGRERVLQGEGQYSRESTCTYKSLE